MARPSSEAEAVANWQRVERAPFAGWDFSRLAGHWHEEHPPWSYAEMARSLLRGTSAVLDLGTGGGECLAAMAASGRSLRGASPDASSLGREVK